MTSQDVLKELFSLSSLPSPSFVIAVSGGVDSVALLSLLAKELPGERLVVAHFDHATRAKSKEDARWVETLASRLGLRFYLGVRRGERTSEEALRKERLQFLKEVRLASGCDYIVTAHHANDQLETLLMRLLRGTGKKGLAGMLPKRGRFLKPLLRFSKEELQRYAEQQRLSFRTDASNDEDLYFRNQVRHQLVPAFLTLSTHFGPEERFWNRFSRLMKSLQEERRLEEKRIRDWVRAWLVETPYFYRTSEKAFQSVADEMKAPLIDFIWKKLTGESLPHREMTLVLKGLKSAKRFSASGKVDVRVSCGEIYWVSQAHLRHWERAKVTLVGKRVRRVDCWDATVPKDPHFEIREFRPGDRFQGKKLKTWFLAHRIPDLERRLLPLLALRNSNDIVQVFPALTATSLTTTFPWASAVLPSPRKSPSKRK